MYYGDVFINRVIKTTLYISKYFQLGNIKCCWCCKISNNIFILKYYCIIL